MTEFIQIAQSFGIPVAMLAVLIFFLWRVLVWLKPRVDAMIDSHIKLVENTSEAVKNTADTLVKMSENNIKDTKSLVALTESHTKLAQAQERTIERLEMIKRLECRYQPTPPPPLRPEVTVLKSKEGL